MKLYKKYLATTRKEVTSNSFCALEATKAYYTRSGAYLKGGACILITAYISGHSDTLIFPGDSEAFYNSYSLLLKYPNI